MAGKLMDQEGGHDLNYVLPPDQSLYCGICLTVARRPQQHSSCGQLFCRTCIQRHQKQDHRCPHCRTDCQLYFEDNRSNRQIQSLTVRCANEKDGCCWVGDVMSLEIHVTNKCDYRKVACPQKCGKDVTWMKMDLHRNEECLKRDYTCPECFKQGAYCYITGDHIHDCIMALEKCPTPGCNAELCSALIYFHMLTTCEFTPLECKYELVGCKVKLPRQELDEHERNVGIHFRMALDQLTEYKLELEESTAFLEECQTHRQGLIKQHLLKSNNSHSQHSKSHTSNFPEVLQIYDFSYFLSSTHETEFLVNPNSYKLLLQLVFDAVGQRVQVFLRLMRGPNDHLLEWPFTGNVKIELLNQQNDCDHYERTITFPGNCGNKVKPPQFESEWKYCFHDYLLYKELRKERQKYAADNKLYFRITANYSKPWITCAVEPRMVYSP